MKKTYLTILSFLIISSSITAQVETRGTVENSLNGDAIYGAYIHLSKSGKRIETVLSDFDGNYYFKSLDTGVYDIVATNRIMGYDSFKLYGILVDSTKIIKLRMKMRNQRGCIYITTTCGQMSRTKMKLDATTSSTTYSVSKMSAMPAVTYFTIHRPKARIKRIRKKESVKPNILIPSTKHGSTYPPAVNITSTTEVDSPFIPILELITYPNPSNGNFTIKAPQGINAINVVDGHGSVKQRLTFTESVKALSLNLESYPNGTYYIQVRMTNQWVTKKVVIAKLKT